MLKIDSQNYFADGIAELADQMANTKDSKRYQEFEYTIYPEFDFLSNKGYGTSHHYDALRTYGVTPIHRKSFLKS